MPCCDFPPVSPLRGLKDFTPKPWKDRFRELQAAGGRIDIVSLRAQQGEAVAVTSGSLGITPKGGLEGELRLTVAGLERLMPALGVNPNVASDRLAPALSALERFSPGLGAIVRERAPNLAASMGLGGEQAQLEGKPAVTLPLRFNDGAVSLGPLPLGQLRPLF
jgi:hypothetical protein